jgi:hypothetical protein
MSGVVLLWLFAGVGIGVVAACGVGVVLAARVAPVIEAALDESGIGLDAPAVHGTAARRPDRARTHG